MHSLSQLLLAGVQKLPKQIFLISDRFFGDQHQFHAGCSGGLGLEHLGERNDLGRGLGSVADHQILGCLQDDLGDLQIFIRKDQLPEALFDRRDDRQHFVKKHMLPHLCIVLRDPDHGSIHV